MNRSANFNFYLPGNADPMRISDITYNFEQIDENVLSVFEQTLTSAQQEQVLENIGAASAEDLASIDGKVSRLIAPRSLITSQNASGTSETFNTYDGRKFSDHRLIVFALYTSATDRSLIRNTMFIPGYMWESGKSIQLIQNHGTNLSSVSGIQFTYASDTSLRAFTLGAGLLTGFEVIGYRAE